MRSRSCPRVLDRNLSDLPRVPSESPRTVLPSLEDIGQRLYDTRAAYMVATNQGLTQTYNQLKDPNEQAPEILALRVLHEEMDRAVLDAYGWNDLAVPPFCPLTADEQSALEAFSDEVIDRLFVLNAARAEDEARRGLGRRRASRLAGRGRSDPRKSDEPDPQGGLF